LTVDWVGGWLFIEQKDPKCRDIGRDGGRPDYRQQGDYRNQRDEGFQGDSGYRGYSDQGDYPYDRR